MNLKISNQDFAVLQATQPRARTIKGALIILIGLTMCFVGAFIAIAFNLSLGLIIFIVASIAVVAAMPLTLKSEELIIQPGKKEIQRISLWGSIFHRSIRDWDTKFISNLSAEIIRKSGTQDRVGVFLHFKNGEKEQVLSEIGSAIPHNCMKYINMMLEDKEVPEGIFTD